MIPAEYYYHIYLFIIVVATIALSSTYSRYPNTRLQIRNDKPQRQLISLIFITAITLFIGLRPISPHFVDMMNYDLFYRVVFGYKYKFSWDEENYLFDNLFNYMASDRIAIIVFFFSIAIIYFGFIYISCRKLFPKDTLYAIVIYLGAFSTFTYGTNGIKAGAAASLFLCAIAYYRHLIPCLVFLFLSLGFHHSMILPITAFIICRFVRSPRLYIRIWAVAFIIAVLHITYFQTLFGSYGDETAASYLADNKDGYRTGFRLDFVIYSALPIALGYWCIFKRNYQSKTYNLIFNTYVLSNAVWMLCMYASFTNRIAYLSWLMIPFVLIYPFFDKPFMPHQYKTANGVAWYHLGFTLFMFIVYYGLLS